MLGNLLVYRCCCFGSLYIEYDLSGHVSARNMNNINVRCLLSLFFFLNDFAYIDRYNTRRKQRREKEEEKKNDCDASRPARPPGIVVHVGNMFDGNMSYTEYGETREFTAAHTEHNTHSVWTLVE